MKTNEILEDKLTIPCAKWFFARFHTNFFSIRSWDNRDRQILRQILRQQGQRQSWGNKDRGKSWGNKNRGNSGITGAEANLEATRTEAILGQQGQGQFWGNGAKKNFQRKKVNSSAFGSAHLPFIPQESFANGFPFVQNPLIIYICKDEPNRQLHFNLIFFYLQSIFSWGIYHLIVHSSKITFHYEV